MGRKPARQSTGARRRLEEVAPGAGEGGHPLEGVPEGAAGARHRDIPVTSPDREFFLENQKFPGGCDAVRQDGRELRGGDSPSIRSDRGKVNASRH